MRKREQERERAREREMEREREREREKDILLSSVRMVDRKIATESRCVCVLVRPSLNCC